MGDAHATTRHRSTHRNVRRWPPMSLLLVLAVAGVAVAVSGAPPPPTRARRSSARRSTTTSGPTPAPGRAPTVPPVYIRTDYIADFRPTPGVYDTTTIAEICIGDFCVAERDVPLGFPENFVPAANFLAEVYSGNSPMRVSATLTIVAQAQSGGYPPHACRRTSYRGVVGQSPGVVDVPIVDVWTAGDPSVGSVGRPLTWTQECAFQVPDALPRLTSVTSAGGSRRLALFVPAGQGGRPKLELELTVQPLR